MSRHAAAFACTACDAPALRWAGRCARCGQFGTVVEATPTSVRGATGSVAVKSGVTPPTAIAAVDPAATQRHRTGLEEFDLVVGGGLTPGQTVLLAGEPGIGKSTLALAVADAVVRATGGHVLYVSGEESIGQVTQRARRVGNVSDGLFLAEDTDLGAVLAHLETVEPRLLVVDSVQTMVSPTVEGRAGGVAQVVEVASVLCRVAKSRGLPVVLIGQSTKDSAIAGPRSLEHLVDTVLTFEGDRHTALRVLRAVKNRFGPADELACFEQTDTGLLGVSDPSAWFRSGRSEPVPGTALTVVREGRRAIVTEVQALVTRPSNGAPRRWVTGLDATRVAMLVAVVDRCLGGSLAGKDVYVSSVAGLRIQDPAADLAVCMAIASAAADLPGSAHTAHIGEVALSGEIRPVPGLAARIAEAQRQAITDLDIPAGGRTPTGGGRGVSRGGPRTHPRGTLLDALSAVAGPAAGAPHGRGTDPAEQFPM